MVFFPVVAMNKNRRARTHARPRAVIGAIHAAMKKARGG
jgi:hypothetical protein